jgi:hypothetical protein
MRRSEFHLRGTQTKPVRLPAPQLIPGVLAADCQFDFDSNTVTVDEQRFVSVVASRTPFLNAPSAAEQAARSSSPITSETIRAFTDDEVMLLLEDHARRVIAGPDSKLIAPGKISLLPIVAGKLRHRAENGELLDTTAAETRWLAEWIASKVTLHQVPTAGTIAKVLGSEYKQLKARSKAAIQTLKG